MTLMNMLSGYVIIGLLLLLYTYRRQHEFVDEQLAKMDADFPIVPLFIVLFVIMWLPALIITLLERKMR